MLNLKRVYAQSIALGIAIAVTYFFAFSEKYWIVLAVFLVMQTRIGVSLRQGLQLLLLLLLWVIVGSKLSQGLSSTYALDLGIGALIISLFFGMRAFVLAIVFFIALIHPPLDNSIIYHRVYDITIGAAIGIFCNYFIFPIRPEVAFREAMAPVLRLYANDLSQLLTIFLKKSSFEEMSLQFGYQYLPSWVHQPGLSTALQVGYRHFLLMVVRVSELLASLHVNVRYSFDEAIVTALETPMNQYVAAANKVFAAIIGVLELNQLTEPVGDLKEEWVQLEKTINEFLPATELLEDLQSLALLSVREDFRDLRITLMSLGNSLQTACATMK